MLEEVISEHPEDIEARRHYAHILAALGEDHEALEQYASILKINPNHVESIGHKGAIFLRQGNRPYAVRCLREYLALMPGDAAGWITLLEILTEMDQPVAVIATAGLAVEAKNERPEIYVLRGRAYLEDRQFDLAISDFRRARALNNRDKEVHFLLARAYAERGRLKHSLLALNRALQLDGNDRKCLLLKARLHRQLKEFEQEEQVLTRLVAETPEDFRLVKMLADNFAARTLFGGAEQIVDAFLERQPEHRRGLLWSAELAERNENIAKARVRFEKLMDLKPVSARAYLSASGFLIRRGEINQAETLLNNGAGEYPADAGLQMLKGVVLQMLSRHRECLDHLDRFQKLGGVPAEFHWLVGKSHFALGNYQESLLGFEAARNLGAGSGGVSAPLFRCLVCEAYCLHNLGRTGDAIKLLEERWGEQDVFVREYHEALSGFYLNLEAYEKAGTVCETGIERGGESATLHLSLARASAALGRKRTMLRHLKHAMQLDPELAFKIASDKLFNRYALSPSLNRLVKFAFLRQRAEFAGWVLVAAAAAAAIAAAMNWQ